MSEVLTPDSMRWELFVNAVSRALFKAGPEHHRPWYCDHTTTHAEQALTEMGDVDVSGSLAFFKERAGCFDCEIMLNVPPLCPDNGG